MTNTTATSTFFADVLDAANEYGARRFAPWVEVSGSDSTGWVEIVNTRTGEAVRVIRDDVDVRLILFAGARLNAGEMTFSGVFADAHRVGAAVRELL